MSRNVTSHSPQFLCCAWFVRFTWHFFEIPLPLTFDHKLVSIFYLRSKTFISTENLQIKKLIVCSLFYYIFVNVWYWYQFVVLSFFYKIIYFIFCTLFKWHNFFSETMVQLFLCFYQVFVIYFVYKRSTFESRGVMKKLKNYAITLLINHLGFFQQPIFTNNKYIN